MCMDMGKKEITNQSFPAELSSAGGLEVPLQSLGVWTLISAEIWVSLSEG